MTDSLPATARPGAGPMSLSLRLTVFLHAVMFVLGFATVFVVGWGGAATLLGQLFYDFKSQLGWIGGLIVIFFGIATMGVLTIPFMNFDTRPQWSGRGGGVLSSAVMGLFFAAGWSPCVGPTLGAILTLGMSQQTTGQAMILSSGYALGLGLPFLALVLMMDRATGLVRRMGRHLHKIKIVSGVFLIAIGVLMVTNNMTAIASWALRNGLYLDFNPASGAQAAPSYLIAIAAGLLSFLSPCVLPLVPAYLGYLSGHAVRQAEAAARG
ncbi:MAG: cytochrome c biogenesis protein CcdA [Chloroflexi bacterium]|nr:cytochrome c biogenesis protein CcdA [Chloroflexota bacterium]